MRCKFVRNGRQAIPDSCIHSFRSFWRWCSSWDIWAKLREKWLHLRVEAVWDGLAGRTRMVMSTVQRPPRNWLCSRTNWASFYQKGRWLRVAAKAKVHRSSFCVQWNLPNTRPRCCRLDIRNLSRRHGVWDFSLCLWSSLRKGWLGWSQAKSDWRGKPGNRNKTEV